MILLDLTLPTPEENLAMEEALLEWCEAQSAEVLRLWESERHFVVLGAGSPSRTDVNRDGCLLHGVPVLRRCSGGGTVLQGPGCLNFTVVLDRARRPELDTIANTNEAVLSVIARALAACGMDDVAMKGYSDLTVQGWKFSGNAQRRRKQYVLFHGTVLHSMNLDLVAEVLGAPEKMPDYREGREHLRFIRNIPVDPACARREIASAWAAPTTPDNDATQWLLTRTTDLATTRYRDSNWIWGI